MIKTISLLLTILASNQCLAKEIKLATFLIPKYVKNEKEGSFIELTNLISKLSNKKVTIEVLPPKRTVKLFHEGKIDGYFPALNVLNSKEVHRTSNFYIKEDFVFYHKDSPVKDITNKSVCLTRGYPYAKSITTRTDVNFVFLSSDQACFKYLQKKRVHSLVVEEITGLKAKDLTMSDMVGYDKKSPVSQQDVYYAFQNTEEGRGFAKAFNKALQTIKDSGQYEKIFSFKPPQ